MTRAALNRMLLAGLALAAPACGTAAAAGGGSYFTLNLQTQKGTPISGIGSTAPAWDGQGRYFAMAIEPEAGKPIPGKLGQAGKASAASFYSIRPGEEGAPGNIPDPPAGAEEIVPVAPELPFPTRIPEFKSPEAPPLPAPEPAAQVTPMTPAIPAVAPEPPPPTAVATGGDKGQDDDSGGKKKKQHHHKKDKDK